MGPTQPEIRAENPVPNGQSRSLVSLLRVRSPSSRSGLPPSPGLQGCIRMGSLRSVRDQPQKCRERVRPPSPLPHTPAGWLTASYHQSHPRTWFSSKRYQRGPLVSAVGNPQTAQLGPKPREGQRDSGSPQKNRPFPGQLSTWQTPQSDSFSLRPAHTLAESGREMSRVPLRWGCGPQVDSWPSPASSPDPC